MENNGILIEGHGYTISTGLGLSLVNAIFLYGKDFCLPVNYCNVSENS